MKSPKVLLNSLIERSFVLYAERMFSQKVFSLYSRGKNKQEFEKQRFITFNERPVEYGYVFQHLSKIYPTNVLDVGTGTIALPSLMRTCGFMVTAIDNIRDYWSNDMLNPHFHIVEDDITKTRLQTKFDLITCVSVLEHIVDFNSAVKNMISLLNTGGYLILTFPYCETHYVRNVYELSNSTYGKDFPFITQAFSRHEVTYWATKFSARIVDQEYWQFWTGEFWTVDAQIIPPKKVSVTNSHQLSCVLLQKM